MVREVSLHSTHVSDCLDGQLTTALVPTVPSLCFLVQSTTIAKHFGISFVLNYPLRDQQVVAGGRQSGQPWPGPGLVRVMCASLGLIRQFFTIAMTRETLLLSLSVSYFVRYSVCTDMPKEIMADI